LARALFSAAFWGRLAPSNTLEQRELFSNGVERRRVEEGDSVKKIVIESKKRREDRIGKERREESAK
jgi:hypothetical protein